MKVVLLIIFSLINHDGFSQSRPIEKPIIKDAHAGPQTFAIIIGINNYKKIRPLEYAKTDAQSFCQLLLSPIFKMKPENINSYYDSSASRSNIYEAMYDLQDKLKPNDLLIFYFAGHGDVEAKIQTNNSLLLLSECPNKDYLRSAEFLDMNTLKEYFISLSSKKVRTFFICDACHSGNLIGGNEGLRLTAVNLQQPWSNEIKLLSCQPNELSRESKKFGSGRGVFTYFLEMGCKGLADNNGDGLITLGELKRYLEKEVAFNTDDNQNPMVLGDPKLIVNKIDESILAFAKNAKNNIDQTITFSTSRNISDPEIINEFKNEINKHEYFEVLSYSTLSLAKKILENDSLKEYKSLIEREAYNSAVNRFDVLIQHYYNGEATIKYKNDYKELCEYLNSVYPILKNKFYSKDIYVKKTFLRILYQTTGIQKLSGNAFEAIRDTITSLKKLNNSAPFLYKFFAELLFLNNQFDETQQELNAYTSLLPNDPYAYNFLGMAFYKMNINNKAIESFQKAILLKNDFSDAYYNLAIVLNKIGNKTESRKLFEKSRKIKQPIDDDFNNP